MNDPRPSDRKDFFSCSAPVSMWDKNENSGGSVEIVPSALKSQYIHSSETAVVNGSHSNFFLILKVNISSLGNITRVKRKAFNITDVLEKLIDKNFSVSRFHISFKIFFDYFGCECRH